MSELDAVRAYREWKTQPIDDDMTMPKLLQAWESRADAAIAACLDEIKRLNEICDRLAAAGRSDHA